MSVARTVCSRILATSLLAVSLLAGPAAADDAAATAVKWRLAVSGTADADARLQFRVTPATGEPIVVTAEVARGRGPMTIAKHLCDAFKAQLPKGIYRCEVMHGEEVLVKAGHGQPPFALELVESTLTGARVQVSAN